MSDIEIPTFCEYYFKELTKDVSPRGSFYSKGPLRVIGQQVLYRVATAALHHKNPYVGSTPQELKTWISESWNAMELLSTYIDRYFKRLQVDVEEADRESLLNMLYDWIFDKLSEKIKAGRTTEQ